MKNRVFTVVYWTGKVEFVEDLNVFAGRMGYQSFWNRVSETADLKYLSHNAVYKLPHNGYKEHVFTDGVYKYLNHSFYVLDMGNNVMTKSGLGTYVLSLPDYMEYCHTRWHRYRPNGAGTGRGKYRPYRSHEATNRVRAAAAVCPEEGEPPFKGKHTSMLLSFWWDEAKPRSRSRSWKDQSKRSKQYKGR